MRSVARTVAGIVLLATAGFGLAWLFMKKHSAEAAERTIAQTTETPKPAAPLTPVTSITPAHKHRAKHPRRGAAAPVAVAEKPVH